MTVRSACRAWPVLLLALACGCGTPAPRRDGERPRPSTTTPPAKTPPATTAPADDPPASRPSDAAARELQLRVVGVHDGDTLTGLDDTKTRFKVRLHGIDAPEIGQAHGQASKRALSGKVFGKDVTVSTTTNDRYGRTVGRVFIDGRDVNLEMLEEGMAWHYTRYDDSESFARAEADARSARKGLWRDNDPRAPWDHRAAERDSKRTAAGR